MKLDGAVPELKAAYPEAKEGKAVPCTEAKEGKAVPCAETKKGKAVPCSEAKVGKAARYPEPFGENERPKQIETEEKRGVTIGEIARLKKKEEIFADDFFAQSNHALFEAMRASQRFQTVTYGYYVNIIDREAASQFSALTCFLAEGLLYVAFRGTDETLAGWREDFAMAYEMPVRSQELAAWYLQEIAERCEGRLIIGGHSKGGNLAVYAAMHCPKKAQGRIRLIYDLDGPGFLPEVRRSEAYCQIEDRIRKIVPHSSLIGMLFEDAEAYEVVESSTFGVLQHNPFSWIIRDGSFTAVKNVYRGRKAAVEVLNRWLYSLTREEAEDLIETFFSIVEASEAETLPQLTKDWRHAVRKMLCAAHATDRETRQELKKLGRAFFDAMKEAAKEHMRL